MLKFDFLENGPGLVSLPHSVYDFSKRMFLMLLYYIIILYYIISYCYYIILLYHIILLLYYIILLSIN